MTFIFHFPCCIYRLIFELRINNPCWYFWCVGKSTHHRAHLCTVSVLLYLLNVSSFTHFYLPESHVYFSPRLSSHHIFLLTSWAPTAALNWNVYCTLGFAFKLFLCWAHCFLDLRSPVFWVLSKNSQARLFYAEVTTTPSHRGHCGSEAGVSMCAVDWRWLCPASPSSQDTGWQTSVLPHGGNESLANYALALKIPHMSLPGRCHWPKQVTC